MTQDPTNCVQPPPRPLEADDELCLEISAEIRHSDYRQNSERVVCRLALFGCTAASAVHHVQQMSASVQAQIQQALHNIKIRTTDVDTPAEG